MDFRHYDEPEKARKVYREYVGEITSLSDGSNLLEAAVAKAHTVDELDVRLDQILTTQKRRLGRAPRSSHIRPDDDSSGYQSNAIRALEDS